MFRLILYEPEIPPNTGNIIRLCANTGTELHLVGPLGFELDDRRLRRAGLDYREFADVAVHDDLAACIASLGEPRVFACSTRGGTLYSEHRFEAGDALLLGPLAVAPRIRGQGCGVALMETGLQKAKALGHGLVILVGDEPYYARVGFQRVPDGRLIMPGYVDPDRLLYKELVAGSMDGVNGLIGKAAEQSELV